MGGRERVATTPRSSRRGGDRVPITDVINTGITATWLLTFSFFNASLERPKSSQPFRWSTRSSGTYQALTIADAYVPQNTPRQPTHLAGAARAATPAAPHPNGCGRHDGHAARHPISSPNRAGRPPIPVPGGRAPRGRRGRASGKAGGLEDAARCTPSANPPPLATTLPTAEPSVVHSTPRPPAARRHTAHQCSTKI